MIKNILLTFGICLCIGVLAWSAPHWLRSTQSDFAVLKKDHIVHDFEFETVNGDKYALYDFKGKNVLIHFWATWCPPCIVEFPELLDMASKNKNLAVIAISTDRNRSAMDRFLTKHDIPDNFYIVFDDGKKLTEGYFGTYQLPETLILSQDMMLHDKILGAYANWHEYDLN